ncbi:MAG TPA: DUF1349 domain-containing protein [Gemmataceae bacterium]|nr:DUF1349 domain-containing protein [Gemmataceae bacterium]
MNKIIRVLIGAVAISSLAVAGCNVASMVGGPFANGWDKPVDPDGDCVFLRDMSGMTMQVPGKYHDLAVERNVMNAPRLLRDAQGDFTAQTSVSGPFLPSAISTAPPTVPFLGAGLLVMDGDRTYARLERAAMNKNGQVQNAVVWELRMDGRPPISQWPSFTPQADRALSLRLQRKGDRLLASVSQDGVSWTNLQPFDAKMSPNLKIGVAAISTSQAPFLPHFDSFSLTPGG